VCQLPCTDVGGWLSALLQASCTQGPPVLATGLLYSSASPYCPALHPQPGQLMSSTSGRGSIVTVPFTYTAALHGNELCHCSLASLITSPAPRSIPQLHRIICCCMGKPGPPSIPIDRITG
jgi:hypothetical protein